MLNADIIRFGFEDILSKFDEVCKDYETIALVQKNSLMGYSSIGSAMACAIVNPIAAKYQVTHVKMGAEDFALPGAGSESFSDILETIGKAIMAVIDHFWSWLKSFFDGSRDSKKGSGGGGGGSSGRKEREAKAEKYKKDEDIRKKAAGKPKQELKPEEKEKFKSRAEILTDRMDRHILAFAFLNPSFKQKDLMEHLKSSSANVDKLLEVMVKASTTIKAGIETSMACLTDLEEGKGLGADKTLENLLAPISQGSVDSMTHLFGGFEDNKNPSITGQITINEHGTAAGAKLLMQCTRSKAVVAFLDLAKNAKTPRMSHIRQFDDGTKEEAEKKAIKFSLEPNQSMTDYSTEYMAFGTQIDIYSSASQDFAMDLEPISQTFRDKLEEFLKSKKGDKTDAVEYFRAIKKLNSNVIEKIGAMVMIGQHLTAILRDHAIMLDLINDAHNVTANDPDVKIFA